MLKKIFNNRKQVVIVATLVSGALSAQWTIGAGTVGTISELQVNASNVGLLPQSNIGVMRAFNINTSSNSFLNLSAIKVFNLGEFWNLPNGNTTFELQNGGNMGISTSARNDVRLNIATSNELFTESTLNVFGGPFSSIKFNVRNNGNVGIGGNANVNTRLSLLTSNELFTDNAFNIYGGPFGSVKFNVRNNGNLGIGGSAIDGVALSVIGALRFNTLGTSAFLNTNTRILTVDSSGNLAVRDATTLGLGGTTTNTIAFNNTNNTLTSTVNGVATNVILPTSSSTTSGLLTSVSWGTFNNKQNAIALTTTGTSGAATFNGTTLNIPQYAGQTYTAGAGVGIVNNVITNTSLNTDSQTLTLNGNTLEISGGNSVTLPTTWSQDTAITPNTISTMNRVLIGTTNTANDFGIAFSGSDKFNLGVNGKILAEEVQVITDVVAGGFKTTPKEWADKVFENDYKLMPLGEVQEFITKNKHLPEIPSEKEVLNKGIEMTEMNVKLLQKVEELTLYLIQQEKEMQELKARLEKVENK